MCFFANSNLEGFEKPITTQLYQAEWSWAICISSPYISRGLKFTFNAEPKKPRTDDKETEMDEIWYTSYLQYEKI